MNPRPRKTGVGPVVGLTVVVWSGAVGLGATCAEAGAAAVLGNQFLELAFQDHTAVRLTNKLSGRAIPLQSDGFSIGVEGREPLRPADFAGQPGQQEAVAGGRRLTFCLQNAALGIELKIIYELGDHDFFVRRRLELSPKAPLSLRQVDVWLVKLSGKASSQGLGQPVLLEDTFWGLEFPAGHHRCTDGLVQLTQYPGRTVADRFTSKTAVLGVAEPGRVAKRFQQYVEGFRVTPKPTALFVNYNTWWTLMPPTEQNSRELIELFKQKLFDPYGESIDTFTLDEGWDDKNSLWAIRGDRFPRGFAPLVESLKRINARLGIWLSPSSGYRHAPWGVANGYEGNSNPWYLCQSGPKYRRDIVKVVTELAEKYDVAFFKFDGFCPSCEAPGHGHLPGLYAQEANVDAFIELMSAVRQARPNIYLDPTCGMWLSPWWLRYADSLWGNVSVDYPEIIVPAPVVRDSATTTRDGVFRQRCQEHPGYPPAAIEHLGIIVITPEKWEDNAMIVVGRGCRLLTLYIDPKHFTRPDRDWAFLAALLKWVRHHAETLQNTELILGDPLQRQAYGYAHFRGPRGIVALRNPFIDPCAVEVKLDESSGWSRADSQVSTGAANTENTFAARIVYPRHETLPSTFRYGDVVRLTLQGYETMIVHVEPISPGQPVLLGARAEEIGRSGRRVNYAVHGRPGHALRLSLAGVASPTSVSLDGAELSPVVAQGRTELAVSLPGQTPPPCSVEGARLEPETVGSTWQLTGACTVQVAPGVTARLSLLCDPRTTAAGPLDCEAWVNGKAVTVRATRTPEKRDQAHGPHSWSWFSFDVPPGRSAVSIVVKPAKPGWSFARGEVGWWLCAEQPLTRATLALEFAEPLAPAPREPLPLPIHMGVERQEIAICAAKAFRAGHRWPKTDQPVVHLDEVAPDEVAQDWGKLQRNRSVWQKPMTIAGKKFARGLGTHANGRLVFDLAGGGFKAFRCQVGRDEHADDGRVEFEVWLDGKRVFQSGPMTRATPAKPVEVDVQGAAVLELRSLDGGDGISGDHANWGEAQLLR